MDFTDSKESAQPIKKIGWAGMYSAIFAMEIFDSKSFIHQDKERQTFQLRLRHHSHKEECT